MLAQGGNAVDAFAATAFALSVTDVSQTGLGGGGAMTFFNAKTKTVEHLSFYPRAGEDAAWARSDGRVYFGTNDAGIRYTDPNGAAVC